MRKILLAGAAGLILTSGVALADEYSSKTTTRTDPLDPGVSSTTRVDKSSNTEDGMLTNKTKVYHSTTPMAAPSTSSETTTKKTTTTTDQ